MSFELEWHWQQWNAFGQSFHSANQSIAVWCDRCYSAVHNFCVATAILLKIFYSVSFCYILVLRLLHSATVCVYAVRSILLVVNIAVRAIKQQSKFSFSFFGDWFKFIACGFSYEFDAHFFASFLRRDVVSHSRCLSFFLSFFQQFIM